DCRHPDRGRRGGHAFAGGHRRHAVAPRPPLANRLVMFIEVRHAWRAIRRMPVVAAVIVLSLGIGIGVHAAGFSWIQAVILRPLPGVPDAGGFFAVEPRAETGSFPGASWLEYADLRERLRAFPDLLAFRMTALNVGEPGRSERAYGLLVSGNYFSAL